MTGRTQALRASSMLDADTYGHVDALILLSRRWDSHGDACMPWDRLHGSTKTTRSL